TRGLFDVVMCDYVLNSVDSQQAQADVLACLNAFCKPGGQVYFSGRKRDRVAVMHAYTKTADSRRYAEFPDEHGLSALFRAGQWFFQKFHSAEEVAALVRSHFDAEGRHQYRDNSSTAWQVSLVKAMQAPDIKGAIDREFNLPLPNGRRFGRQADVWSALAPLL
ncbi:MAG TPA: hypothetical protein VLJ58_16840, partial [Ramlibacter sp.]|nr:hypothetical protein [Ramlibacter sp.]